MGTASSVRSAKIGNDNQLRVEYLPLSSLKPAKRNPKRHQIDTVLASMDRFGYVAPMILNERTGRLVAGHGRLESLKKAKKEGNQPPERIQVADSEWLVPVVRGVAFADDREAEAYLLADNQTTILGGWNDDELKEIIASLGAEGVIGTGFEAMFQEQFGMEQDDPTPLIDHASELQKKWETARGQLWTIGEHRLLCGDSTSESDVKRLMNGQRACLFATDPPYLVDYNGTNHPHRWTKAHGRKHPGDKDWSDKYSDVDSPEKGEQLYDAFVKIAVAHAITEDAAWYCWHASRKQRLLEAVWEKYGAFVHQQIIWVKDRPILTRSWYMWQHEPCFMGWIKGHKPKRVAKDYPPSVWSFPTIKPGETTDHPTEKPLEVFAIPIRQHTNRGDLCFDPFSGSGSQLVAAERLGRVCYAMELSPPFVAVALERVARAGLRPKLESKSNIKEVKK
ncbi:MAG TPA: DNA methyltransferase [Pyrinomonadaceae bacterium]|nr:DNA methyltransferase [Pyrinomonadaceae bacterium]